MDSNPFLVIAGLLLAYWPFVLIGVVVLALFVGGPLLGCVVVAVVGAAGARVSPSEETRDVDVTEFFEEQAQAGAAPAGRDDAAERYGMN